MNRCRIGAEDFGVGANGVDQGSLEEGITTRISFASLDELERTLPEHHATGSKDERF